MLKVIKPVDNLFWKAVDYPTYHIIKQSARYDDDVANELHCTAKNMAIQKKDRTFSGKLPCLLLPSYRSLNQPEMHV